MGSGNALTLPGCPGWVEEGPRRPAEQGHDRVLHERDNEHDGDQRPAPYRDGGQARGEEVGDRLQQRHDPQGGQDGDLPAQVDGVLGKPPKISELYEMLRTVTSPKKPKVSDPASSKARGKEQRQKRAKAA